MTATRTGADVSQGEGAPPDGGAGSGRTNSTLVAAGIGLSRLTGLVRERAVGHYLGYDAAADAFTAGIRIPNLIQDLLGEGVLSASFIPVYSRLLSEGREEEAGRVAGAVLGLLVTVAGVLVLLGVALAEPLTTVVAAGLRARPETFELTVRLVRLLFPAIGLLAVSAWCLGVLNSHRRFFLSYVAPVVVNVAQVVAVVGVGTFVVAEALASPTTEEAAQFDLAVALGWGTVAGGLLQVLVQLPTVRRVAAGVRPSLRASLPGVQQVLRSLGPVVAARGVVRLSSFVQVFLASFLAAGGLATLRYGQLLYALPVSLFGMSVAAAELPELSRSGALDDGTLEPRLRAGLARIAAFVVPTTVAYLVVGDLLVAALFQTGRFDRTGVVVVWAIIAAYATGLLASTASRLLQSALYGLGDTRTPSRAAVVRIVLSMALGAALMLQFDRVEAVGTGVALVGELPAVTPLSESVRQELPEGVLRLGTVGLGLAAGIAAWVEYVQLRRAVWATVGPVGIGGDELRPILVAAATAAVAGLVARPVLVGLPRLAGGVAAGLVVGVPYLLVASRLGVTEVRSLLRAVLRLGRR